jgi:hypothetical protein
MNAVHEAIASFKEKQRHVFQTLQQQQNLVERDLELFAERLESAAWQEEDQPSPAHHPLQRSEQAALVGSGGGEVCSPARLTGLEQCCQDVHHTSMMIECIPVVDSCSCIVNTKKGAIRLS